MTLDLAYGMTETYLLPPFGRNGGSTIVLPAPPCFRLVVASLHRSTSALSLPHLVFVIGPSILTCHPFRRYRLVALECVAALCAATMAAMALELIIAKLVYHLPPLLRILG